LQRVLDAGDAGVDVPAEVVHDPVGRRQEQLLLAAEVAVEGTLADAEVVGQDLEVEVGVAVAGEEHDGALEDLLAPLFAARRLRPGETYTRSNQRHDDTSKRTGASVRFIVEDSPTGEHGPNRRAARDFPGAAGAVARAARGPPPGRTRG